ncbi:MAG: M48 family metalloprotease [Candidatus Riflebacteria bacterium]|nr:M48 family metalloprotease [Candidatus Riflebacteria bacterium]
MKTFRKLVQSVVVLFLLLSIASLYAGERKQANPLRDEVLLHLNRELPSFQADIIELADFCKKTFNSSASEDLNSPELKKFFHKFHAFYISACRKLVNMISVKTEVTVSNDFFQGFFLPTDNNPVFVQQATDILNKLKVYSRRKDLKYKVGILEGNGMEAFAKGGEMIVLSEEIVRLPADESAAVIAHEMSHLEKRDYLKSMIARELNRAIIAGHFPENSDKFGKILEYALARFQRFHEYETDIQAVNLMQKAGYKPDGMISLLERLLHPSDSGNIINKDHPVISDRINAVKRHLLRLRK